MAIILIDLVLAGDNAIVIALAARSLPAALQRKASVWGTVGAIVVRASMTVGVVWLLRVPGLMAAGGLGLLWIAYQLLGNGSAESGGGASAVGAVTGLWGAIRTVVVADALMGVMGVDNVLGVAGAAHGAIELVIIGLALSVPIVVFGSTVVLHLVERFSVIIRLGAAVLAWTARADDRRRAAARPRVRRGAWRSAQHLRVGCALGVACVLSMLGLHAWAARRQALRN